jgi:hypothetical protein
MHDVTVSYTATDNCSGVVTTSLSVTSNEDANGKGDGNTSSDWEIKNEHEVKLRAERSGNGTGRIYTITITATDAAGNSSSRPVNVYVSDNNSSNLVSVTGKKGKKATAEALRVTVSPNPSTAYFVLNIQSSSVEPIQLKVSDAVGRVIENKAGLSASSSLRTGHNFQPGIYYAELIQGNRRVLVKLVKAAN